MRCPTVSCVTAQETLQRICAAYHACIAEFRRRVPTDYFDKEMKVIDKGLPGCNATSTPSSGIQVSIHDPSHQRMLLESGVNPLGHQLFVGPLVCWKLTQNVNNFIPPLFHCRYTVLWGGKLKQFQATRNGTRCR